LFRRPALNFDLAIVRAKAAMAPICDPSARSFSEGSVSIQGRSVGKALDKAAQNVFTPAGFFPWVIVHAIRGRQHFSDRISSESFAD
jgi:hypothetical protein